MFKGAACQCGASPRTEPGITTLCEQARPSAGPGRAYRASSTSDDEPTRHGLNGRGRAWPTQGMPELAHTPGVNVTRCAAVGGRSRTPPGSGWAGATGCIHDLDMPGHKTMAVSLVVARRAIAAEHAVQPGYRRLGHAPSGGRPPASWARRARSAAA